jgi:hypothetical protein
MYKSLAVLLMLISMLTGCYWGSGNTARRKAVATSESGASVLFNRPAKDARVNWVKRRTKDANKKRHRQLLVTVSTVKHQI